MESCFFCRRRAVGYNSHGLPCCTKHMKEMEDDDVYAEHPYKKVKNKGKRRRKW